MLLLQKFQTLNRLAIAHLCHANPRDFSAGIGQAVGTVLTGILTGVFLLRTVGGLVGTQLDWRTVY